MNYHISVRIVFSDSSDTAAAVDQSSQPMAADGNQSGWHYRSVDLSSYAGKTISTLALSVDSSSGAGSWDISFQSISYVSSNGDMHSVYERGKSVSLTGSGTAGMTQAGFPMNHDVSVGPGPCTTRRTTTEICWGRRD